MTTETSIYEYAKQGLKLNPDKIAIWFYGKSITYRELFEKIDNVADHLYELGVREGTVVTIHLPNCPQAIFAIYAVAKLGGICNMVHSLLPESALRNNLRFTGSSYLITHLEINNNSVVGLEAIKLYEKPCVVKAPDKIDQVNLAAKCAFYLNSSGSTGKPKTIMLSHSAVNNCVDNTAEFFENKDMAEQVSLGVLPLFHGFGLAADVHRNIHFSSTLVIMSRWNPSEAADLIKKYKVTLIVGVPAMFHSLLNEQTFYGPEIKQLRYCYTGGDNINQDLVVKMNERLGNERCMFPGYGLTEATTMNCVSTWSHYKSGTAGYPVNNTTIAVMKSDGTYSNRGIGELIISSPTLMMGYLNDPEATKATLFETDDKLWTHTGDEVEIDSDGFIVFRDRIKNIIIHNGYNIYPDEVEEVIRSVSGVKDVCVVGVDDEEKHTQNIRAVVIASANVSIQMVQNECARKLPRYSIPKEILFVDRFPQNSMGKIDRKELGKI